MSVRLSIDPEPQFRAAAVLGGLMARGLVSKEIAAKTMGAIVRAARQSAPNVDPGGLRCRLIWTARDAAHWTEMQRRATENAIWRAIKPALVERASTADLMAIALEQNNGDPPLLSHDEVRDVVARAIAVHLATLRRSQVG